MKDYYTNRLFAENLKKCYQLAPKRIQQYLLAETRYVQQFITPNCKLLELGCGYGRAIECFQSASQIVGIDNSLHSLRLAKKSLDMISKCQFALMSAEKLSFRNEVFDLVVCIQNGISAFKADQKELIKESVRVTKKSGTVLFSTYSEKIWDERLNWFRLQSDAGLLGKIDYGKTKNGQIVCEDGFQAATLSEQIFRNLCSKVKAKINFREIDESSLFCEIYPY